MTDPDPKLPRFPLRRHFFAADFLALERGNQWPSPPSTLGSRAIVSPSGIRRSSLAMSSRSYAVNALAIPHTVKLSAHAWKEYLMKDAELRPK